MWAVLSHAAERCASSIGAGALAAASIECWIAACAASLVRVDPAHTSTEAAEGLVSACVRWSCLAHTDGSSVRAGARAATADLLGAMTAFATRIAEGGPSRRASMARVLTTCLLAVDAAASTSSANVLSLVWRSLCGFAVDACDGRVPMGCQDVVRVGIVAGCDDTVATAVVKRIVANIVSTTAMVEDCCARCCSDAAALDAVVKVLRFFLVMLSKLSSERPAEVISALSPCVHVLSRVRGLAATSVLLLPSEDGSVIHPTLKLLRTQVVLAVDNTIIRCVDCRGFVVLNSILADACTRLLQ